MKVLFVLLLISALIASLINFNSRIRAEFTEVARWRCATHGGLNRIEEFDYIGTASFEVRYKIVCNDQLVIQYRDI